MAAADTSLANFTGFYFWNAVRCEMSVSVTDIWLTAGLGGSFLFQLCLHSSSLSFTLFIIRMLFKEISRLLTQDISNSFKQAVDVTAFILVGKNVLSNNNDCREVLSQSHSGCIFFVCASISGYTFLECPSLATCLSHLSLLQTGYIALIFVSDGGTLYTSCICHSRRCNLTTNRSLTLWQQAHCILFTVFFNNCLWCIVARGNS